MNNVKVVIGANYGDEGKGVTTDYLCRTLGGSTLNVLYNGGMQRGHTVKDFTFHCFGAATLSGADTYYDWEFMINPIAWVQELINLNDDYVIKNRITINPMFFANWDCPITTPYDIQINRAIEKQRGVNRHGSCGMGILETYKRSQNPKYRITFRDLGNQLALYRKLQLIRDEYVKIRLDELNINSIDEVDSIDDFMKCSFDLFKIVKGVDSINDISAQYRNIIFEAGQGLLLSADRINETKHLTPSYTGLDYITVWLNNLPDDVDVEVIYVTRSYITRHGAGNLQFETNIAELGLYSQDTSNVYNDYQGSIRYGRLQIEPMLDRINKDFDKLINPNAKKSLSITWLDKTGGFIRSHYCGMQFDCLNPRILTGHFNQLYTDCYEIS